MQGYIYGREASPNEKVMPMNEVEALLRTLRSKNDEIRDLKKNMKDVDPIWLERYEKQKEG